MLIRSADFKVLKNENLMMMRMFVVQILKEVDEQHLIAGSKEEKNIIQIKFTVGGQADTLYLVLLWNSVKFMKC